MEKPNQTQEETIRKINDEIRQCNIMIGYHQMKIKKYRQEKHRLHQELDTLKDGYWDDV